MKPSERIKEISEKIKVDFPHAVLGSGIDAIIEYLDEEYEKNKPCEHKNSYQVDSQIGDIYYNVCNDCGVLFLAK